MEDVDQLLLQAIKNVGCELEGVASLAALESEQLIESVVRLLWSARPECRRRVGSFRLPPNMSSRFRAATAIASEIQALGYTGDVGYQTLLYGNVSEMRRLFVFLVEKLPKDISETAFVGDRSSADELRSAAAEVIRRQLGAAWVPWFCDRLRLQWDGRFWCPSDESEPDYVQFRARDLSIMSKMSCRDFASTMLETAAAMANNRLGAQSAASALSPGDGRSLRETDLVQMSRSRPPKAARRRPQLPPKPLLSPVSTLVRQTHDATPDAIGADALSSEASSVPTTEIQPEPVSDVFQSSGAATSVDDDDEDSEETKLLDQLHDDYSIEISVVTEKRERLKQTEREFGLLESELGVKRSELSQTGNRYAAVLQRPQESVLKLESFIEQSDSRMAHLEAQWAETRAHKQTQLESLVGRLASASGDGDDARRHTADMNARCVAMAEELEAKRDFLQQLEREYTRLDKSINRSAYTKRIFEIVASVRKQRAEIDKVIGDNRLIQKEISMLSGNLYRTFVATEERLFKDARGDEALQRAYKLLVGTHENCAQLVKTVETTGNLMREIADLQDQMEIEAQKSTDANLERLVNDYCEMRSENDSLSQKLEQHHSPTETTD